MTARSFGGSFALLLALVIAWGCAPEPMPDGGRADAGTDAAIDAGTDAPEPPSMLCRPCRRDVDCGEQAFCTVYPDGAWGCAPRCASDEDCSALPIASRCAAEAEGLPLGCRPTAGTCAIAPAGEACGEGCTGTYDRCAEPEPGLGSYCTTACATDADCPVGLRRCLDTDEGRLCVRDEASLPERCDALIAASPLPDCAADRSCTSGRCVGVGHPRCFPVPAPDCPLGMLRIEAAEPFCVPDAQITPALTPDCACLLDDGGLFDEAVALTGRDRCDLHFPHAILDRYPPELSHDALRLSFTDRVHSYWLAAPVFADAVADALSDDPASALRAASGYADLVIETEALPDDADVVARLSELWAAAGGTPDVAAIEPLYGDLTGPRAIALARMLSATRRALEARERALARYDRAERGFLFDAPSGLFLQALASGAPSSVLIGAMRGDVDLGAMASASLELIAAEAALTESIASAGTEGIGSVAIDTPSGAIVIAGTGDDVHQRESYLLLIELGGDDAYRAPVGANASIDNGVSVAIDLSGEDDYGYLEVPVAADVGPTGHERLASDGTGRASGAYPASLSRSARQGAGRLGIGLLVDRGVDVDHYRSLRMSQGYGALGIGVLFDEGGDDVYVGEAGVQGAAVAGVGLLIDGGGTDRYVAYHASQGFAFTRGVGVLFDASGDDVYFAHPSDVLYYSPQSPGVSNSSFTQGVAFGRRDDAGGTYMSGGLGVLRDVDGHDRYTCGIFCQASGYWYGTGLLLEGGGDDHYDGEWYAQAGDAHFAVAVLLDERGDDTHNETAVRRNAAVGGGHDFSSAWLIDRDGADVYRAPNLSLGTGHAGGFGALIDLGGIDDYAAASDLSFGNASIETPGDPARRAAGSVGIFLDRGGLDAHMRPTPAPVANDATWTQAAHVGESELGAGLDRETGAVGAGLE